MKFQHLSLESRSVFNQVFSYQLSKDPSSYNFLLFVYFYYLDKSKLMTDVIFQTLVQKAKKDTYRSQIHSHKLCIDFVISIATTVLGGWLKEEPCIMFQRRNLLLYDEYFILIRNKFNLHYTNEFKYYFINWLGQILTHLLNYVINIR